MDRKSRTPSDNQPEKSKKSFFESDNSKSNKGSKKAEGSSKISGSGSAEKDVTPQETLQSSSSDQASRPYAPQNHPLGLTHHQVSDERSNLRSSSERFSSSSRSFRRIMRICAPGEHDVFSPSHEGHSSHHAGQEDSSRQSNALADSGSGSRSRSNKKALQHQLNEVNQEKNALLQENQYWKHEVEQGNQETQNLRHQLTEVNQEKNALSQEKRYLKNHIEQNYQKQQKLSEKFTQLQQAHQEVKSSLTDEKQILERQWKDIAQQINEKLSQQQKVFDEKCQALQHQLTQAVQEKDHLQGQSLQYQESIVSLNRKKEDLQRDHVLDLLENDRCRERLNQQIKDSEQKLTQARLEKNRLQHQLDQNQQQINRLNRENQTLTTDLQQAHQDKSHLLQEHQQNQQEINLLNQQIKDSEQKLTQDRLEKDLLQHQYGQKQQEFDHLNQEKENLERQLTQAHQDHSGLLEKYQQKQQAIGSLNRQKEDLECQLTQARQENNELAEKYQASSSKLERANQQKDNLTREIAEFKLQLQQHLEEGNKQVEDKILLIECKEELRRKFEKEYKQWKKELKENKQEDFNQAKQVWDESYKKWKEKLGKDHQEVEQQWENANEEKINKLEEEYNQKVSQLKSERDSKLEELDCRLNEENVDQKKLDCRKQYQKLKLLLVKERYENRIRLSKELQEKIMQLRQNYKEELNKQKQKWQEGYEELEKTLEGNYKQRFDQEKQEWQEEHKDLFNKTIQKLQKTLEEKDELHAKCEDLRQKLTKLEQNSKYLDHLQLEEDVDDYLYRHVSDKQQITPKMRRAVSATINLDNSYWGVKTQNDLLPLSYPPQEANSRSEDNIQLPSTGADISNSSSTSSEKNPQPREMTQKDKGKQIIASDAARGDLIPISQSNLAQLADTGLRQDLRPADDWTSPLNRLARGVGSLVVPELHQQQVIESTQEELVLYAEIAHHLLERGQSGVIDAFNMAEEKYQPEIDKLREDLKKCEKDTTDYDIIKKRSDQEIAKQTLYRTWMTTQATHTKSKLIAMSPEVNRQAQSFGATSKLTEILNKLTTGTSTGIPYYGPYENI